MSRKHVKEWPYSAGRLEMALVITAIICLSLGFGLQFWSFMVRP